MIKERNRKNNQVNPIIKKITVQTMSVEAEKVMKGYLKELGY